MGARSVILNSSRKAFSSFRKEKDTNKYVIIRHSPLDGRLENDAKDFLSNYFQFILNGENKILSDFSIMYVSLAYCDSVEEVVDAYNEAGIKEQLTITQGRNHLYYDTKRLHEYFDDDMIQKIIQNKGDIDVYRATLESAKNRKEGKSILNTVTPLKLPNAINPTAPSKAEIENFMNMLTPYTNTAIENIESSLSIDVIGYLNYLSYKAHPTDEERRLLKIVESLDKPKITQTTLITPESQPNTLKRVQFDSSVSKEPVSISKESKAGDSGIVENLFETFYNDD